ncbi:carbonic anhydrase [Salinicola avicenniae]|uniref:carbonic anhydrase n=1 Tax=Salinicola avicenniae TaxID=2916836 RepID=UPI00207462D6|nr:MULTISPECIES: carbonic anhydrase [unclassified Salinicola]
MQFFDRLMLENRAWADEMEAADPGIFERLHEGQAPSALWIGCCDSRVPAEQICNVKPGELFIHRNIANLVHETDDNAVSVLEYALNALKVDHIIVCGHRGCGGIQAAVSGGEALAALPSVERHLAPVKQLVVERSKELESFSRLGDKVDHVVELNVTAQVERLARMPLVQEAWAARRRPTLRGWVYDLASGRLEEVCRRQIDETSQRADAGADDSQWRQAVAG